MHSRKYYLLSMIYRCNNYSHILGCVMLDNQLDQAPTIFDPHSKRRKHGKEQCAVKIWDALDTRTGMSTSR